MRDNEAVYIDELGREVCDPRPVAVTVKMPSQRDMIRDMIRRELSMAAESQEFESFEEADDFDVDDDTFDPSSPYEEFFDPQTGESNFERAITDGNTASLSTAPADPPEGSASEAPAAPAAGPAQ